MCVSDLRWTVTETLINTEKLSRIACVTIRTKWESGENVTCFCRSLCGNQGAFREASALSNRKACVSSLWSNLKVRKCSNRARAQWFSSDTGRVSAVKQMCSALAFPRWGLSSGTEINSTKEINALRLFVISRRRRLHNKKPGDGGASDTGEEEMMESHRGRLERDERHGKRTREKNPASERLLLELSC